MKTLLLAFLFIISLSSCMPSSDTETENCGWTTIGNEYPRTSGISGVVLDNHTKEGISGAQLMVRNFTLDKEKFPSLDSGEDGNFSIYSRGCPLFKGNQFKFDGISHPEYTGYAASNDLYDLKILMFKTVDVNLIFNNSSPETTNNVKYRYSFCLYPDNICNNFSDGGEFISSVNDTLTIKVAEGENITIKYARENEEFRSKIFDISSTQEIVIDY